MTEQEFKQLIISSVQECLIENHSRKYDENSILTLQEASEFLKIAKQTIYGYTSKRLIPHIKKGKKLYFHRESLEKWLSEGRQLTEKEIFDGGLIGIKRKGGKK